MAAPQRSRKSRVGPAGPPPDPATTWYDAGNRHLAAGRPDDAIAAYDRALGLRPAFPEALRAGGALLRDRGFPDNALRFLDEALRLRPAYLDAILDKGNMLYALGRHDEALATFASGLAVLPRHGGLLANKGAILHSLGRLTEACAALEAAVAADPALPQAHLNHAGVLMRMFRHAEALPVLDRAIALRPIYAAAHANRGLTLKMLGRFEEAAEALDRAVAQEPGNAYALTNRGELRLLLGDYERGLLDYQARLETEWQNTPLLTRPVPFWSGQDFEGLRIVAIADAGFGDVIHFVRYIPMLVAAGADVTVICRPRLRRLLEAATKGARVVDAVADDDTFDCLIPFSNLPFVFSTTLAAIPAATPYLAVEPARIAAWSARVGAHGFKVGLTWRGNQDWRADPHRSIALAAFAPLASIPGVRLIALQADDGGEHHAAVPLERFAGADAGPDGFVDTAAIMESLDLIVSIDTSLAHLAGALGRPACVLLRHVPEWRWLLDRDDTPWYPTMRLFRQRQAGDWAAPVEQLVAHVRERVAAGS